MRVSDRKQDIPLFFSSFGAPPRGDAPMTIPMLDRAVYSGGR